MFPKKVKLRLFLLSREKNIPFNEIKQIFKGGFYYGKINNVSTNGYSAVRIRSYIIKRNKKEQEIKRISKG